MTSFETTYSRSVRLLKCFALKRFSEHGFTLCSFCAFGVRDDLGCGFAPRPPGFLRAFLDPAALADVISLKIGYMSFALTPSSPCHSVHHPALLLTAATVALKCPLRPARFGRSV